MAAFAAVAAASDDSLKLSGARNLSSVVEYIEAPSTAFDHITFMGYTHVMCTFSTAVPDISALRHALTSIIRRAPFVAGTVQSASTGRHCIGSPYETIDQIFTVHETALDYANWKESGCPVRDVLTFCAAPPTMVSPPAPVTRIKLTIARGGCFLSTSIHHATIDGAGLARVVQAWAAECRGAPPVELNRWNGPPLHLDKPSPSADIHHPRGNIQMHPAYILMPDPPFAPQPVDATVSFHFSGEALARLKFSASVELPPGSWISTGDALTALLWTRLSRAIGRDAGVNVATNARSRFDPPIPHSFVGNAVYFVYADPLQVADSSTTKELDLPKAALAIRRAIHSITPTHLADIAALGEHGGRIIEAHAAPNGPVAVSSWHAQEFSAFDWGPAFPELQTHGEALCERILAPKWLRPRLCIILPQRPGGMDVAVGLKAEHMNRLLKDDVFMGYAVRESGWPAV